MPSSVSGFFIRRRKSFVLSIEEFGKRQKGVAVFRRWGKIGIDIDWRVWAVLFSTQLAYCIWHVLAKKALLDGFHPLTLAMYRELIACPVMHLLAWRNDKQPVWMSLQLSDLPFFLLMGVFSFCNVVGFIMALEFITAFNSTLLHPTIPVFAAFLGIVVGVEPMSTLKAFGIVVCGIGSVIVTLWGVRVDEGEIGYNHNYIMGNAILMGQCLSMAALLVMLKVALKRLPPTTISATHYTVAMVLTSGTTLILVQDKERYEVQGALQWSAVLIGAFVGVTYVSIALAWVTRRTSAATAAVSMTLQPVLGAILSVAFMGRTGFSWGELLGGLFVILGLIAVAISITVTKADENDDEIDLNPNRVNVEFDFLPDVQPQEDCRVLEVSDLQTVDNESSSGSTVQSGDQRPSMNPLHIDTASHGDDDKKDGHVSPNNRISPSSSLRVFDGDEDKGCEKFSGL